tara:strand:+ start:175 stop:1053 length:879 start_codon:yes stop_codon:yes gene_type:complete
MKVNNFLVTGANLATMGYIQKPGTTPPLDGSIMNKGESSANYYIDQTAIPWSDYTDSRAPKYQDFPCPCVGSVTVDNSLEGGFSQYIEYQDCSGNVKYLYIPYGQAAAIQGCITQEPSGIYTGCGVLRGSVVGVKLASVVYSDCCPGFTACTTTSTTTIYIPSCNYNGLTVVCDTPSGYATLQWSYSETGGANGVMDIYINGVSTIVASTTGAGTYNVYPGDTISVNLDILTACGSPDTYANVYTTGNLFNDASCANNAGVSLTTGTYTVVSGDVGGNLIVNTFAACDGGCI